MEKIMVIGAAGQIGSELVVELRKKYGPGNVWGTDIKMPPADVLEGGPFQVLDVMDDKQLIHFIIRHKITQIYHLAAVLSGNAEKLPIQAWNINMDSLMNTAMELGQKIFLTSSTIRATSRIFIRLSIFIFHACMGNFSALPESTAARW